jgi:glycogen synthase
MNGWGDKPLVGVVSRLTKQKGEQQPRALHFMLNASMVHRRERAV